MERFFFLAPLAVKAGVPEAPLDDAWMYTSGDSLVSVNSIAFSSKRRFICPLIDFSWSNRQIPIEVQFIHELVPPVLHIVRRPSGEAFKIHLNSRELLREATCGDVANGLANSRSVGDFESLVSNSIKIRKSLYDEWIRSIFTRPELAAHVVAPTTKNSRPGAASLQRSTMAMNSLTQPAHHQQQ